ncbi:MAG: ABC-F family ATP-binding cassette domain-containing protein [Acidaminococcaceae bacterium]|nr:ABC-F family ATP-binding cassette domain-containing protein [Acidaminococcaceae bacterium]
MSYLNVTNVSHSFGGRQILEDVSFKLLRGEHVGLVGANGEGKSTFLNIVTGHTLPDEGKVEWPGKVTVGYLDQQSTLKKGLTIRQVLQSSFDSLYALEAQMLELYEKMGDASPEELDKLMHTVGEIQSELEHAGFYSLDSKIEEFANGLGLGSIGLDKDVSELSGGQRSKVLLTKLLLQNAKILLLDEPTNYLDVEHIEWLTKFLQNYEHAFILISHDTAFLNKVVNIIYHLENCALTRYTGNYDKFREMYAIYQAQKASAYERQQQEVAKLEDFIARNKARVATTNMAKSRQRRLDKMDMIEKPREKIKPTFKFREARTPSRFIVEAKNLVLGYDAPLTRPVTFNLERGEKIALRGVNGLGKTTLLKTILGLIPPVSGSVELGEFLEPGYFEQEEREKNEHTALDDVWNEYPGLTNYEVRAALAGCGLTNEHITSKVFVLSGGEAAKVRLCKLMLKDVNWLVLDEPTNHLDVDAKEELKKAIREFKGSVLLVSHEPEFYEDWIDKIWNIEDWTTKII